MTKCKLCIPNVEPREVSEIVVEVSERFNKLELKEQFRIILKEEIKEELI